MDPRIIKIMREFMDSPDRDVKMAATVEGIQPIAPICDACGTTAHLVCSKCRSARYCGAVCQRAHWATHKALCAATSCTPDPAQGKLDVRRFQKKRPGFPLVLRGDRLFSVLWDTLDVRGCGIVAHHAARTPSPSVRITARSRCHRGRLGRQDCVRGRRNVHQGPCVCFTSHRRGPKA